MPTYEFTSPEGKTYQVEGPEGSTQEQAFGILQSHLGTAEPSFASKLGRQAGLTARYGAELLGTPVTAAADILGKVIPGQYPSITEKFQKGLTELGFPEPKTKIEKAVHTGVEYAPLVGGAAAIAKPVIGKAIAGRATEKAAISAEREPVIESAKMARELGMKIPPQELAMGESGYVAKGLRSVTGKETLAANASLQNAKRVDSLIREDLNIPKGTPLTKEVLSGRIAEEGKNFEKIREFPAQFVRDDKYLDDIYSVGTSYTDAARNFPLTHGRMGVDPIIQELSLDTSAGQISPAHAIDNIRRLRQQSSAYMNVRHTDPKAVEMATVYRDAADALEGLIQRNLKQYGNEKMYNDFVNSREKLAKLYDAKDALHSATGTIDASLYRELYEKNKPLSGNAEKIGRMASAYPHFFQHPYVAAGRLISREHPILSAVGEMTGVQPLTRSILLSRKIPWKGVEK